MGMDDNGALVAIKLQNDGIFAGKVGDVNFDGIFDPRDLLTVYDPETPEQWREGVRRMLTSGERS